MTERDVEVSFDISLIMYKYIICIIGGFLKIVFVSLSQVYFLAFNVFQHV